MGLVAPALQAVLALVFLGFDYSFGLFLLAAAFYGSFVVVAMSAPQGAAAVFFAIVLVLLDGLLFLSTLFGLDKSPPSQSGLFQLQAWGPLLVLVAGGLRWVGSYAWLCQMKLPPAAEAATPASDDTPAPGGATTIHSKRL